jgi:anaerobic selenocysteine-containing dehydrogenase
MIQTAESLNTKEVVKNGICYMCTHRCASRIHVFEGKATQIEIVDPAVAALCPRGKAQLDFVYHPERLKQPLKRQGKGRNGAWIPTSWDDALDIVAGELLKVKKNYGPESVVFWIAYTKEPRPYFTRLTHAFGSPNYCTESSNCSTAQQLATMLTYGKEYRHWTMQGTGINPATKLKLLWTSGVKESNPPAWQAYIEAKKAGLKLIVVDPRRTPIATMADIHLQLRPGTDGALALGMMNVIINKKLYDKEFMEKWTVGFEDLKKLVNDYTPKKVKEITWVPASKIEEAAVLFAKTKHAQMHMSACSTTHHSNGVQNHRAIILLSALTGNFDIPGGNVIPPAPIPTNDITLNDRVPSMPLGLGVERFPVWTSMIQEMQSNLIAERIENGKPYPIKALFGAGLNPMYFINSSRFVEAVKKLDFVVATDYFHTPGTQLADVVLPISSWIERQILITGPGAATYIEPAIEPVGQTWPELKIYFELAKRLGLGKEFWDGDIEACFNYILEPSKITVKDLANEPGGTKKIPAPAFSARHYEKAGFKTPSGKVEIASSILAKQGHDSLPTYKEPVDSPVTKPELQDSFPLVLTTGARKIPFTHSSFRNIAQLHELMPDATVDINPGDAKTRNIEQGNFVMILTPRGACKMKANLTDNVMPGVVIATHQWPGEANVNQVVSDKNLDPISGFGAFKSMLCNVMRA